MPCPKLKRQFSSAMKFFPHFLNRARDDPPEGYGKVYIQTDRAFVKGVPQKMKVALAIGKAVFGGFG